MKAMNAHTTRRTLLAALAGLPLGGLAQQAPKVLVEIWKAPECGCCEDWAGHLQASGFAVKIHNGGNDAMRAKMGLPDRLASCHTGLVGGYALEGHVPAREIRRLLQERPQAVGLAVPGMPVGSPGMDGPVYQGRKDPFDVLLVGKGGITRVYASYPKA
ncbi:MAG TPA: DUF411 domain-containing protein [Ramlibacter sp.]|uniref:DUF411 domain-containing protein n=1 Tax=Ramlibacter sp. TaxID=1917967 RepID=UPI002D7FA5B1|nr:DUF411 domain-containing protein [Ramlibacter sp.]HET8747563.1 DUF411 domain-containing protein [Ramlibacter sp.]